MTRHVRASQLKIGDTIKLSFDQHNRVSSKTSSDYFNDRLIETVTTIHHFDKQELGQGAYLPACVLIEFQTAVISVEPRERFKLED